MSPKRRMIDDASSSSSDGTGVPARLMARCSTAEGPSRAESSSRAEGSSRAVVIPQLIDEDISGGVEDFAPPPEKLFHDSDSDWDNEDLDDLDPRKTYSKKKKVVKRDASFLRSDNPAGIFPSWSTPRTISNMGRSCGMSGRLKIKLPMKETRPWHCPKGYVCLYESFFTRGRLWFPLPQLLVKYCLKRRIAISQLTCMSIQHLVSLMLLGGELGINVDLRFLEETCAIKNTSKPRLFYLSTKPKHQLTTHGTGNNVKDWQRYYFFVEIDSASSLDPVERFRRKWNPHYGRRRRFVIVVARAEC